MGGGVWPISYLYLFFSLAIFLHSEVLKHIYNRGEVISDQYGHLKLSSFTTKKNYGKK